jgi:hypothetical protein
MGIRATPIVATRKGELNRQDAIRDYKRRLVSCAGKTILRGDVRQSSDTKKRPTVGVTTLPPPAQPPIRAAGEESPKAARGRQALSAARGEFG